MEGCSLELLKVFRTAQDVATICCSVLSFNKAAGSLGFLSINSQPGVEFCELFPKKTPLSAYVLFGCNLVMLPFFVLRLCGQSDTCDL